MTIKMIVKEQKKSLMMHDLQVAKNKYQQAVENLTDFIMQKYNISEDDAIEAVTELQMLLD